MRTSLILFSDPLVKTDAGYIDEIFSTVYKGGFSVDNTEILSVFDDLGFKRSLVERKERSDVVVIVGGDIVQFNLKNIVAEVFETELLENQTARKYLEELENKTGTSYDDKFAQLPLNSTAIPNENGPYQAFMIDEENVTVVVLPGDVKTFNQMYIKYVVLYLENKFSLKANRQVFKYIGEKRQLLGVIDDAKAFFGEVFSVSVTENNLDYTINIASTICDNVKWAEIIRYFMSRLKEDIYAEFETLPEERVFDLLKLKNLKISVAESFTGGRIASSLIKNSGVSDYFHEGIVAYSNKSKMERLGVSGEDLIRHGAVSSIVAYQMVAGLLKTRNCDIAVSTTGIAGPKSDDTLKPVGLCYIAVGTMDGVHTYKYNFKGTREQITEQAKNTALGLVIKKLKTL